MLRADGSDCVTGVFRLLGIDSKKPLYLQARNAEEFDALGATLFAAPDSNSGFGGFQKAGEKLDKRFIGTVFDGWGAQADLQCAVHYAGNFIAAGAGLNADGEGDGAAGWILGNVQETHGSPGALILNRRFDFCAESLSCTARPVGIAEHFASQQDDIGLL